MKKTLLLVYLRGVILLNKLFLLVSPGGASKATRVIKVRSCSQVKKNRVNFFYFLPEKEAMKGMMLVEDEE